MKQQAHNYLIRRTRACIAVVLCICAVAGIASAKTRWSSLRLVPDSDLLPGGEFTVGFDGFLTKTLETTDSSVIDSVDTMVTPPVSYSHDSILDTTESGMLFRQTYMLKIGVVEWVNIHIGYSGGFTMGFKARILGETSKGMPSLAVGVHNLFNHVEVNLSDYKSPAEINNEFYVAMGKSIEKLKLRFHLGFQSMPTVEDEVFNPFFAIEKYFGFGLYTSLEMNRRALDYHFHLFANMRAAGDKLEVSAGVYALETMFFDQNQEFSVSLTPRTVGSFVNPGIWLGVRFHGIMGLGQKGGFKSVEDKIDEQNKTIDKLKGQLDSMKTSMAKTRNGMQDMSAAIGDIADSAEADKLKKQIMENLEHLKILYAEEEFNPDSVNATIAAIRRTGEPGIAALKKILVDETLDRHVRIYCVNVLGTFGNRNASDVLLDVLARTGVSELKIEVLIALGKMKETRAMYLIEQLANDPNDAIALTAQEVLRQLSDGTGAKISPQLKMREIESQKNDENVASEKIIVKPDAGTAPAQQEKSDSTAKKTEPQKSPAATTPQKADSAGQKSIGH